jgi:hypothetical protein
VRAGHEVDSPYLAPAFGAQGPQAGRFDTCEQKVSTPHVFPRPIGDRLCGLVFREPPDKRETFGFNTPCAGTGGIEPPIPH